MKRILAMALAVVLLVGVLPVSTFAIEKDDPKFERFLKGIGWEKEAYLDYLESKDVDLKYFEYMDELGTPITEESVQAILTEFDYTRENLNKQLVEYGVIEQGQDVLDGEYLLFSEELYDFVEYYASMNLITPENLQEIVDKYKFSSLEEMEKFLKEFGDSYKDYEYIEELEEAIIFYKEVKEGVYDEDTEFVLDGLFTAFGLTDKELDKLGAHLGSLNYDDPAFEAKLTELAERMMATGEFDTADDLTAEQTAEILSIFSELQNLFQVSTQYYLVTDGKKEAISIETLLTLDTTNGFDLLIEVYNLQGAFLADILLTAEMFGSEIIVETGEDVKEVEEIISEAPAKKPTKPGIHDGSESPVTSSTVKGGKLPKTAGDYALNTLIGLGIALIGFVLYRRFKVAGA